MNALDTFNKYALVGIVLLCMLSTCNTCNTRRQLTDVQDRCDSLNVKVGKLETADRLGTKLEITSLETSKRMLYDQNAIVRTTMRPDDRMNQYDEQIKTLEKKLAK